MLPICSYDVFGRWYPGFRACYSRIWRSYQPVFGSYPTKLEKNAFATRNSARGQGWRFEFNLMISVIYMEIYWAVKLITSTGKIRV